MAEIRHDWKAKKETTNQLLIDLIDEQRECTTRDIPNERLCGEGGGSVDEICVGEIIWTNRVSWNILMHELQRHPLNTDKLDIEQRSA